MNVHDGQQWSWVQARSWKPAVFCNLCGSLTPESLEHALDAGVYAQWNGFLDDPNIASLWVFTMELPDLDTSDYHHSNVFFLTHLWEVDAETRKRIIEKLILSSEAEPDHIYEVFEVERDEA